MFLLSTSKGMFSQPYTVCLVRRGHAAGVTERESPCVTLHSLKAEAPLFVGHLTDKEIEAKNGYLSEVTWSDPGCNPASRAPITNHPRDSPGSSQVVLITWP